MGKASRDKGKRGELEAAKAWGRVFHGCHRSGGMQAGHVERYYDVHLGEGQDFFRLESKLGARPNAYQALVQAAEHCPATCWPVARVRADRKQATVTMFETDFLDLLLEWWEMKQR